MTFDGGTVIADLLADLRLRGVEVQAVNGALRVTGRQAAYTAAVKAQLIQLKPEILSHFEREREASEATYEREERAWAVQYGCALACAFGYSDALVRRAEEALRFRPARAPFSIGPHAIVVSLGNGIEARIYRARRA